MTPQNVDQNSALVSMPIMLHDPRSTIDISNDVDNFYAGNIGSAL